MNGRIAVVSIVLSALAVGAAVYWLQVYAYYEEVTFTPGQEIALTPAAGGAPEPIAVGDLRGIDGSSSPLRFRACFTTPLDPETLARTYRVYDRPTPLNPPPWFDCFDPRAIDVALRSGEAVAFLSVPEIRRGVDRVVAVFRDGRAYAWHQLSGTLED